MTSLQLFLKRKDVPFTELQGRTGTQNTYASPLDFPKTFLHYKRNLSRINPLSIREIVNLQTFKFVSIV